MLFRANYVSWDNSGIEFFDPRPGRRVVADIYEKSIRTYPDAFQCGW